MRWKILALLEYLVVLICGIWAIPAVLLIRCLRPWRVIRFGRFPSSRIGDFVVEVCQMYAISQQQSKMSLDLYWFKYKPICNYFLATLVRRNFHVSPWFRPLDQWNQILPGGAMHNISIPTRPGRGGSHGWLEQTQAKMSFYPQENARAKDWLRKQGWQEGDQFVCLLVRDSSYMNHFPCQNTDPPQHEEGVLYDPKVGYGWHHLDYRDSDIATYVPAAEWLADQGVWVLRMGKVMAKPIPSSHHRIIDYAFHPDRSDFLDIWLFAHCDLCIGTGSGPDCISAMYGRPLLYLNFGPLRDLVSWSNAMHLFKTLVWQASGIPLNLREQYNCNEYRDRNIIKIIDLTPEEILAAVHERWQRLQGTWVDTEGDLKRHNRFWEILKTCPDFRIEHRWIHPESRCGAIWLRSKGDDFLN
jgi:putative glycosyltransferase (TIGR04372 family)